MEVCVYNNYMFNACVQKVVVYVTSVKYVSIKRHVCPGVCVGFPIQSIIDESRMIQSGHTILPHSTELNQYN